MWGKRGIDGGGVCVGGKGNEKKFSWKFQAFLLVHMNLIPCGECVCKLKMMSMVSEKNAKEFRDTRNQYLV